MEILKDKSYKTYVKLSRYSVVPIYYNTLDNKYMHGSSYWLKEDLTYSVYTVKENDSYDLIALKFYNNPTLYWVICDFNKIINPFIPPEVGSKIKIPTISDLDFEVE